MDKKINFVLKTASLSKFVKGSLITEMSYNVTSTTIIQCNDTIYFLQLLFRPAYFFNAKELQLYVSLRLLIKLP